MSVHDKEEAAISAAETTADTLQRFAERTRVAELLRVIEHEATKQPGSPEARLMRIADYSREALSALEATPAPMVTEAEVDAALAAFEYAGRYAYTRARIKAALIAAQEKGR